MRLTGLLALALLAGCATLQPPPPDRELGPGLRLARDGLTADGGTGYLLGDAPGACFRAEVVNLATSTATSPLAPPGPEACARWTAAASEGTLAVYSYNEGVVRILERDGMALRPAAELRLPGRPGFPFPPPGRDLALSPDGDTLLVGAVERDCRETEAGNRCGAAYLYRRDPSAGWRLAATLPRPAGAGQGAQFGQSLLILPDGTLLIGGTGLTGGAGALHHLALQGGTATLIETLAPADPTDWFYATDLAASANGGWVAVGGSQYVQLYRNQGGHLVPAQRLDAPFEDAGHFGAALALSGDGTTLLVGAPRASCREGFRCGIAFRFVQQGGRWRPQGSVRPGIERAEADFGYLAALDRSGATSLIGGEMVHLFRQRP